MAVRTVVEHGPRGKRTVAFAADWPGWSRGAKTPDLALETFAAYRERYRPVAAQAGLATELDAAGPLEVVEDKVGAGSTDFWGISFQPCTGEQDPMGAERLERGITLLRACWAFFDDVAARVSPQMARGPRGGGRDRDEIVAHTVRVETQDFARKVGAGVPEGVTLDADELRAHREEYVAAMRDYDAGRVARRMRSWTLPFLVRHTAFHVLDHAWEMQDKDLTGRDG